MPQLRFGRPDGEDFVVIECGRRTFDLVRKPVLDRFCDEALKERWWDANDRLTEVYRRRTLTD